MVQKREGIRRIWGGKGDWGNTWKGKGMGYAKGFGAKGQPDKGGEGVQPKSDVTHCNN